MKSFKVAGQMIKGILFDIGGVILPEEELYTEMLDLQKRALREADIAVSDDEFDAVVRECILSFVPGLTQAITWRFTKPDVEKFNLVHGIYRSYVKAWESPLERTVRPGMKELLESLSGRFILALAANCGAKIRDVLEYHGVLRYFSSTIVSGDLPYSKPDCRFFEHILNNCGLAPDEVIMIGDRLDNDIIPAKMMGMKAVLYKAGPYAILEPRTPQEVPDAVVSSVEELPNTLAALTACQSVSESSI